MKDAMKAAAIEPGEAARSEAARGKATQDGRDAGVGKKVVPRFGELYSCCCLPLLPQFA